MYTRLNEALINIKDAVVNDKYCKLYNGVSKIVLKELDISGLVFHYNLLSDMRNKKVNELLVQAENSKLRSLIKEWRYCSDNIYYPVEGSWEEFKKHSNKWDIKTNPFAKKTHWTSWTFDQSNHA